MIVSSPAWSHQIQFDRAEEFGASYPAFREEVVCTLVETLLSHPQGVVHGLEEVEGAEEGGGGLVGTMKAGARAQAAGSMVDWLGTAKIALQVPSPS